MRGGFAATGRALKQVFDHLIYPVLIPVVVVFGVALGCLGKVLDVHISIDFFKAAASIFPLLFVAMFVALSNVHNRLRDLRRLARETGANMDPDLSKELRAWEDKVPRQASRMVWLSVVGETAALYSLAASEPGTIPAGICSVAMIALVYLLTGAHQTHLARRASEDRA